MAYLLPDVAVSPDTSNTIFCFHDKSTYHANNDEVMMWKDETMQVLKPKGRSACLMASNFIEECDGCLALSTSMHQAI